MTSLSRPRALQRGDRVGTFDCGVTSLNNWFRTLALKNEAAGGSRTFVAVADDGAIAGYYCLSWFTISRPVTGDFGARLPDPIPASLIGRLAVDLRFQRTGLGASLLQDAFFRAVQVSLQLGSAAIVVHARDDAVVEFCERFGFTRLQGDEHTLILPMADAVAIIEQLRGETNLP